MPATRIYIVRDTFDGETFLVEATSASRALRHVIDPQYDVHAATVREVAAEMTKGAKIERAGESEASDD